MPMFPTTDLFAEPIQSGRLQLGPATWLLRGFAQPWIDTLLAELRLIEAAAPFRHMHTPGGLRMSVAQTNCGPLGWISDRHGYRYSPTDPDTGQPWPPLPPAFRQLAEQAAATAGFPGFLPDACLINRYLPGTRLSLHQDKDERDFTAPIVSVSLGLPAVFQFGGMRRADKPERVSLLHGDVLVWGGEDRLRYHGVLALKDGQHSLLGAQRINLTFRRAG